MEMRNESKYELLSREQLKELEERIKALEKGIDAVHLRKLANLDSYVSELERMSKEEASAKKKLEEAKDVFEVKKFTALVNSFNVSKGIVKEMRLVLKNLNDEEVRLRDMRITLMIEKQKKGHYQ